MMAQDRYFYDPVAAATPSTAISDDLEKRYGGIDAVLVWSTYPNMGIDDRNQLEMVESCLAVSKASARWLPTFTAVALRVLFPNDDVGRRDTPA